MWLRLELERSSDHTELGGDKTYRQTNALGGVPYLRQEYLWRHIVTFPRFHRHLYKEECDEIGGRNDRENQTAVHGRV